MNQLDPFIHNPKSLRRSANFQVEGYRAFIALAALELHRIAFIEVLNLRARSKASSVKKDFVAAVVGSDKSVTFLPNDFLDCTRHLFIPPL